MSGLRLVGRGAAFPSDLGLGADGPRALTGDDAWALLLGEDWRAELERRGLDGDRARTRHGVVTREWLHRPGAAPQVERGTERLAVHAAERTLAGARVRGAELDLVVVATSTPDRLGASLAARVAAAVGAGRASFDVRAGGASGVLALLAASRWLSDGGRALVVAAEVPSAYLHADDPGDALLFGDAAGALVVQRDEAAPGGVLLSVERTRPAAGRAFTVPGALPPTPAACDAGEFRLRAPDGDYVEELAAAWRTLGGELRTGAKALGARPTKLCANPATRALVEQVAAAVGADAEPTLATLAQHGACGAAGPLIALAELVQLPPRVALAAVGGGVHAAGLLWEP